MFKVIISIFILPVLLYGSLVNSGFVIRDLQVFDDFDLERSFITDPILQKTYQRILRDKSVKNNYIKYQNNAYLFIPTIKQILKENEVPAAFLYLVMAESNFTINAKSYKKALGLWQFMPETGKRYKLKINTYVDERMDIIKSTKAAVKYLKFLKKTFGKWYLAALAYNCGEGRVYEAITRATIDMYAKDNKVTDEIKKFRQIISKYQKKQLPFSSLYKVYKKVQGFSYKPGINELLFFQKGLDRQYLPGESKNYIRKIISFGMMSNKEFLINGNGKHLLNRGISESIATVKARCGAMLNDVGNLIDMQYEDIYSINKHIKKGILSPEENSCEIYLPYAKLSQYKKNIHKLKRAKYKIHNVVRGDSLHKIGKIYNIQHSLIKKINSLKHDRLSINQKLIIPIIDLPLTLKSNDKTKKKQYIVKEGDTLYSVSKFFKTTIKKLIKNNKISNNSIKIGEKIIVSYD